jgi:hypothetical protein
MIRTARWLIVASALVGLLAHTGSADAPPSDSTLASGAWVSPPGDLTAVRQASYADPSAPVTQLYAPAATEDVQPNVPPSGMPMNPPPSLGQMRSGLWRPLIGAEMVFLAPVHNTGGSANYSFTDGTTTSTYNASNAGGMVASPRLTLGVMGDRWGVAVRYWDLNNAGGGGFFPNRPSQGVYSFGALRLETFDLEAVRRFQLENQQMWFTVGVRQAQFSRDNSVTASDFYSHALYFASANSDSRFSGVGVTASLSGLRPIRETGWDLFYSGRVSYLSLASSSAFAQSSASYTSSGGAGSWNDPTGTIGNGDAFIGEVQLGLQYNHPLESVPATAFFRWTTEYQYWHVNVDGGTSSSANAGPNAGNSLVSATSSAGSSNLGLLGFGIAAGFMW